MQFEIAKPTRKCHLSGREIRPGETFYSVLVETPLGQERLDYSTEAWTGPPENTLGYWKGKLADEPRCESKRQELPVEAMVALFDRLASEEGNPGRRDRLRYVLGLMLVRKRVLKLHNLRRDGDKQWLVVRRSTAGELIELLDPGLTADQTQSVEDELHDWIHEDPVDINA